MADQGAKEARHRTIANRRRLADPERVEWSDRRAALIRRENHFNFIKMHYLTVTTLQIDSYSGLDSSPYGIPSGNHIEDRPVYLVYYW